LYEAARVDGANKLQIFRNITLPGLKNISVFITLSIVINAFQLIIQPMMLTQGGPQNSTATIVYQIYQTGYKFRNVGYGSAMAVVFTVMVLVIVMVQNKLISKTVTILTFIKYWNDFLWPVMVITDTKKYTIQMTLNSLFAIKPVNYGNVMAGLTFITIPVLIIFLCMQKYYVQGIASTGAKN
jgi:ABC-type glycerol-3-phosphate transport system permease component